MFSCTLLVLPAVVWRNAMTVQTNQKDVIRIVVRRIPIFMMNAQWDWLSSPLGIVAPLAFVATFCNEKLTQNSISTPC